MINGQGQVSNLPAVRKNRLKDATEQSESNPRQSLRILR